MTMKKKVDRADQNIPMATAVIVEDIESNTLPSANAPEKKALALATPTSPTHIVSNGAAFDHAANTVIVNTGRRKKSRIVLRTDLGRQPFGLRCQHCNRETITIVEDRIGMGTVIATVFLAIVFWPLCWLPFCLPSCKRTNHFCGHDSCRKKVGLTNVCV